MTIEELKQVIRNNEKIIVDPNWLFNVILYSQTKNCEEISKFALDILLEKAVVFYTV